MLRHALLRPTAVALRLLRMLMLVPTAPLLQVLRLLLRAWQEGLPGGAAGLHAALLWVHLAAALMHAALQLQRMAAALLHGALRLLPLHAVQMLPSMLPS